MRSSAFVGVWMAVVGCPLACLGHGVKHEVFEVGTGVKATYADETPMAYCEVAVFAPDDDASEYQTGITDRNGCFAFVPDTSGAWRVTVDDGMGHLVTADISVDSLRVANPGTRQGPDRMSSLIMGISVIFGLFGVYVLFRGSGRSATSVPKDGT